MNLFVDDTRKFPEHGYICCRDADSAIRFLKYMKFEHISLDYSLGSGKTGLEILIWMKENDIFVSEINIHSNNILGIEKMEKYCKENFPDSKVTTYTLPK